MREIFERINVRFMPVREKQKHVNRNSGACIMVFSSNDRAFLCRQLSDTMFHLDCYLCCNMDNDRMMKVNRYLNDDGDWDSGAIGSFLFELNSLAMEDNRTRNKIESSEQPPVIEHYKQQNFGGQAKFGTLSVLRTVINDCDPA